MSSPKKTREQRFWEKVDRRGPDECWLWTGAITGRGYGNFLFKPGNRQAHRVAYELLVGPIPEGLVLDHLCRVRACVNPAHVEPVTQRENTLRGLGPLAVRAYYRARTHCIHGHPLWGDNVWQRKLPSGITRRCRQCQLDARRRYRERLKSKAAS